MIASELSSRIRRGADGCEPKPDLAALETMPPGPELAAALGAIDVDSLSGADRIGLLIAHRRLASHYLAEAYRDMAAIDHWMRDDGDDHTAAVENTAAEVGAALRLTRRSAESEVHFALLLRGFPGVLHALLTGDIDERRAKVLLHGVEHLSPGTAQQIVDDVLCDAPRLTTGQLAAMVRRRCLEVDPADADIRYRRSVADRRVYVTPNPEGTANLHALDLPPDQVAAIVRRVDRMARKLRRPDEARTMDQLRADVLLDLLEGRTGSAHHCGGVHLHVDLETLVELDDTPGDLAGFGPVVADVARRVADEQLRSPWTFTVTDPTTGDVLQTGITRRRPTGAQRRHVAAHYRTCVWPGCRVPSVDCDLDHRTPYADGGCTHQHNLAPLCRFHHRIRHQAGWSYRRLPDGRHEWTTRLGRRITTSCRSP